MMKNRLKKFWNKLGPGLITGCSDDDPSGIATYSQAGAKFGLATLWTAFITYPLMYSIQEMCARIGIVTRLGLTGVIKKHYSKVYLYPLIVVIFSAITFNIAADLAAMGAVANLIFPIVPSFIFSVIITVILISSLFFFKYPKIAFILKWLCFSLLVYVIVPFIIQVKWSKVLFSTFIPHIEWNKDFLTILVAILGTTISPYLFFWQTNMTIEERNHKEIETSDKTEIENNKVDVKVGMLVSNIIMYFIILTTGTVLFPAGIKEIETVKEAALALKPLAGDFAYLLFALGIITTGLLAIPVLAGSLGYMFAEMFKWNRGLDKKPLEAKGFYSVIFISIILALFLNAYGLNPIQSLIYSAVLYGIIAPFLIALILHIVNSEGIMGNHTNGKISNILGFATFILMSAAAILLLFFSFS